tara:strand:+ start:519 stop:686 length:168 start_codon:yes stop_codon:yes gene_type:complete
MGRMKDAAEDWLDSYGYAQGFDHDNIPSMSDWDFVKGSNIDAYDYYTNHLNKENK